MPEFLDYANWIEGRQARRDQRRDQGINSVLAGIMGLVAGRNQRAAAQGAAETQAYERSVKERDLGLKERAQGLSEHTALSTQAQQEAQRIAGLVGAQMDAILSRPSDQQQAAYEYARDQLKRQGIDLAEFGFEELFSPSRAEMIRDSWRRLSPEGQKVAPKPAEPYTLTPGAQRFGPDDQPRASVPTAEPKPPAAPAVGSFEDVASAAIAEAEAKKGAPLTAAERQRTIFNARKQYMQADDRPPSPATIVIQTVDAQGNPVTRIVPKTPGAEFAAPPTGAQRQQTAENEAVMSGLDRLEALTGKAGQLEQWVGPVQGRANQAQMAVPGVSVDPTMAEFFAEVAAIKNRMIRAITGAQMSEPEAQRIMTQLPDVTQKADVFRARMAATRRNLEALNQAMATKGTPPPVRDADKQNIGRFEVEVQP